MAAPGIATYADLEVDAQQRNLPALQGSPKQIGWALDIRSRFAEELEMVVEDQRQYVHCPADEEKFAMVESIAAGLLQIASAKWWIENRHTYADAQSVLRRAIVEYKAQQRRKEAGR